MQKLQDSLNSVNFRLSPELYKLDVHVGIQVCYARDLSSVDVSIKPSSFFLEFIIYWLVFVLEKRITTWKPPLLPIIVKSPTIF